MKFIMTAMIKLIAIIAVFCLMQESAMAIEKPDYSVEQTDGKFEVRAYPSMILAEVDVMGDRDTAANRGFRKLAGFIFGDNVTVDGSGKDGSSKISMTAPVVQSSQSQKISMTSPVIQKPQMIRESQSIDMTAPVVQSPSAEGKWTVNFMMPSKYSMQTLPKPTDSDIRIFETKPYRSVSIRFSGRGTKSNLAKQEKRLMTWAAEQGLEIVGNPEYAFYNPPIVPPMFRRNEVHYRLKD